MPASRLAQLLLPSGTLGLRAYDVLEEAVFLGPGKHGVVAGPLPFPKAALALTWDGSGFVARSLPGEAPVEVNGAPAEGRRLVDGDRLALGAETVLVRAEAPPAAPAVPRPAEAPGSARRPAGPRRVVRPRTGWNHLTWVLGLAGLGLLLAAGVKAIEHIGALKDASRARALALPEPTPPPTGDEERVVREFTQAETFEREHPDDPVAAVAVWREFLSRHLPPEGGTPGAEVVAGAARLEALHEAAAVRAWEALKLGAREKAGRGRFAGALQDLRDFETRYGGTAPASELPALREELSHAARTAWDALKAKAEPLIATAPRQAHAALISSGLEFPPDLAAEVAAVLERAVANIRRRGAEPKVGEPDAPGERPPEPPARKKPPREPPGPTPPPAAPPPAVPPAAPPGDPEKDARAAWQAARAHLLAGRAKEAQAGYEALLQGAARTTTVKDNASRLRAGLLAARAALEGPRALLAVPVEAKKDRLEMEYLFDEGRVLEQDFSLEKPFASDLPVDGTLEQGEVVLKGATGLFHALVFGPDVRVEVDATAVVAKDFGLLVVQESDQFRALLADFNNTRFTLKKGDNAQKQAGHYLWFIGEGVWSAADKDMFGYIKIAERGTSKVENGDRVALELERRGPKLDGGFQGKTDGVALSGTVKGDDGGTMGAGRVGAFVNGGELRVKRVKISGVVDPAWWAKRLAGLPAGDPGPGE